MTDQVEYNDVAEEVIDEATLAMDSLKPASRPVNDPKSRIEMMTAVLHGMDSMQKKDLTKWFDQAMAVFGPGKDHGVGDNSGKNQSSVDMKASAAAASSTPKTKYPMPKLGVKEDVEEMFAGQDLSEDFKDKATTLFEAAINARIITETARLEEEFDTKLEEAVSEINEELTSKVDAYLDYVVEQWMKDNEVAIESTLRNEITEEFIEGLKTLFVEHYIDVPQSKVDVLESLADKVSELEARLDAEINENSELRAAFVEVERKEVFESMLYDLAFSQQEKFAALAEGIDFDGDVEVYAKKLAIIKENYFATEKKSPVETNITEETFEGDIGTQTVSVDPSVNKYVQAISRTIKR